MKVTIEQHTIHVQGDFTGPYIDLDLSPQDAYNLLRQLEEKRTQIYDLATNYYDCRECGQVHHVSVLACPTLGEEERREQNRVYWEEQPHTNSFGGYAYEEETNG